MKYRDLSRFMLLLILLLLVFLLPGCGGGGGGGDTAPGNSGGKSIRPSVNPTPTPSPAPSPLPSPSPQPRLQGIDFEGVRLYATGKAPRDLFVGDFQGDGRPDFAVCESGAARVSVRIGAAGGQFVAQAPVAVGALPSGLVGGDFDGDGDLDLAVANSGSNSVSLLLGDGHGAFPVRRDMPLAACPLGLLLAEVTGDGVPDLVLRMGGPQRLQVLVGGGNGTFTAGTSWVLPADFYDLAAGDVDGDGRTDLLATCPTDGRVYRFAGQPSGLADPVAFSPGVGPHGIDLGDYDKDGHLDLAVTEAVVEGRVGLLRGEGTGSFGTATVLEGNTLPHQVRFADLEGDGDLDVVALSRTAGTLLVARNRGTGSFARPLVVFADANQTGVAGVVGHLGLRLADMDADDDLDACFVSQTDDLVLVTRQDEEGNFLEPRLDATSPMDLFAVDLNRDGGIDLVTTDASNRSVGVRLGDGRGHFGALRSFPTGASGGIGQGALGDMNRDTLLDLVVPCDSERKLYVMLGDGAGAFGTPATYPMADVASHAFMKVQLGDLDRDGDLDAVLPNALGDNVSLFKNDGTGRLSERVDLVTGQGPNSVEVGDVDGDRRLDLVVSNYKDVKVAICYGDGNGAFPTRTTVDGTGYLKLHDLDGDRDLDLFVLTPPEGRFSLRLNDGQGRFGEPQEHLVPGGEPYRVEVADIDGDQVQDVLIATLTRESIQLYAGVGDGSLREPVEFQTGTSPGNFAVRNLDLDGIPDMAVLNTLNHSLSLLFGRQ